MGKTIEQMLADGMTAAEIHKEVEKLTKEREKKIAEAQAKAAEKEAKKKREQEAKRLHRQEAREKATIAIINWMIAEDIITVDEADRERINELNIMLGETAFAMREEKQFVDFIKKLR